MKIALISHRRAQWLIEQKINEQNAQYCNICWNKQRPLQRRSGTKGLWKVHVGFLEFTVKNAKMYWVDLEAMIINLKEISGQIWLHFMKQYKLSKIVPVYTKVSGNKTKLKGNAVASFSFLYSDMRISSLKRDT